MKIFPIIFALVLASLVYSGCVTRFYGSARVDNGVSGCQAKCKDWGMELTGMVAMGEYSDGCICSKKGVSASATESIGAISAAGAGVYMQMQQDEEEQPVAATP